MRDDLGADGIDVLVIDWKSAGNLSQPFEHAHNSNIVVFPTRVEYRQFELLELGMQRYAVHTECFNAPPGDEIDPDRFLEAFKRAYDLDPVDIRKCIRWALKGSFAPPSVVG